MKDIQASEKNDLPQWLTEDYLEKAMRQYYQNSTVNIIEIKLSPATAKGENYCSIMTRISVTFSMNNSEEQKQAHYIAKSSYEDDPFISNLMNPYGVVNTEMLMYEKILPEQSGLLRSIGDCEKLYAEAIYVDYDNDAIIFEDLCGLQFVMGDRLQGYDEQHARMALKKLAKFHASAAVLNERNNGALEKFDRGIFNAHTPGITAFFEKILNVCAEFAGNTSELGSYYQDKLLRLAPHIPQIVNQLIEVQSSSNNFYTLSHGDFWVNNLMLRYCPQTAELIDLVPVDLQFCAWTTPALDLHYFLNTSLKENLRLQKQGALVQYYHSILAHILTELKYTKHIPSLHELCVQMEAARFYSLTSSLIVQPIMIHNEKSEDADFKGLLLDDERGKNFRKSLYANKVVQQNAKNLLPIFDQCGLLDIEILSV